MPLGKNKKSTASAKLEVAHNPFGILVSSEITISIVENLKSFGTADAIAVPP
jgi:hypothetical protein